jgi:hypothetical protein
MTRLAKFDWKAIEAELDLEGQAVLRSMLSADECDALIALDANDKAFGDVGSLDALLLGPAESRHFAKLPSFKDLRASFYEKLAPIANRWNETMGLAERYPTRLDQLQQMCRKSGQRRPLSAVSRLRQGERQPLRQHIEGNCVFSLQVALLLRQPGKDFTGGELVMTEQRPRMQTRPMVVPLQKGDATVFAVHRRPFKGTKGYYRVNLRHAVSRVRSGERVAIDLLFHDAP